MITYKTKRPEVDTHGLTFLNQEPTFENVEKFVRGRKRASCTELMIAFRLSYTEAVRLMDALEVRGVVKVLKYHPDGSPTTTGPRLLA